VFLFGLSGFLGKNLAWPPLLIVMGRTSLAAATLFLLLLLKGELRRGQKGSNSGVALAPRSRHLLPLFLSGVILALHWFSFFYAIQRTSLATALVAFSSFPLFVTALEPLAFRERSRTIDLITGGGVAVGLFLSAPLEHGTESQFAGFLWGVFSGFTFAVLQLLNRRLTRELTSHSLAAFQNLTATVVLLPALLFIEPPVAVGMKEVGIILTLGVLCTAGAHTLFIASLQHIRAQLASVTAGLEGVYGICLGMLFLNEIPTVRTIVGGGIILAMTTVGTLARESRAKRSANESGTKKRDPHGHELGLRQPHCDHGLDANHLDEKALNR
jgi:drug/metabolite transporter (DMT)-like permease